MGATSTLKETFEHNFRLFAREAYKRFAESDEVHKYSIVKTQSETNPKLSVYQFMIDDEPDGDPMIIADGRYSVETLYISNGHLYVKHFNGTIDDLGPIGGGGGGYLPEVVGETLYFRKD